MVAVIYAAVRAAAFSRAAAQIKMGENNISLCRIVNGSEAGLASSCCQPAAPLAAAMCGNFPGCAARTAAAVLCCICLVVLGLPAMTMEFSVGRAAQASPIRMYQKLEKPGCKWGIFGIASLIGNIALMAFYTVVTGWIIYYFIKFLTGQNADFGFTQMITNPTVNVVFLLVTVVVAFAILSFNLQGGLERITKYMMLALLVLMLVLAVHSLPLPGAAEGLKFYLVRILERSMAALWWAP